MLERLNELRCRFAKRRRHAARRARFEQLEPRTLLTGLPYGAVEQDTAEYMLGNVVATVVFFESDGSIVPSTQELESVGARSERESRVGRQRRHDQRQRAELH